MISLLKSSKNNSKTKLIKHIKKPQPEEPIKNVYANFLDADTKKNERKLLLKMIDMCYNNLANQIELVEILHLPFLPGPISLHSFPTILLQQNQIISSKEDNEQEQQTQLQFLFNYLRNVRQYYYCWIIYFNEELKILNVKLLKKEEIEEHMDMFNPIINLIGIFVNRSTQKSLNSNTHNQLNSNFVDEYFGEARPSKPKDEGNPHGKSKSTFNSTGTTWKILAKKGQMNDIKEVDEQSRPKASSKIKIRSISPKMRTKETKGHSLSKHHQQMRSKKQNKSFSIKNLKQKSKSQILLNRSKSNIKQIILQPIKHQLVPLGQKFKTQNRKTKLKKQSKVHKIDSIYFKKHHRGIE